MCTSTITKQQATLFFIQQSVFLGKLKRRLPSWNYFITRITIKPLAFPLYKNEKKVNKEKHSLTCNPSWLSLSKIVNKYRKKNPESISFPRPNLRCWRNWMVLRVTKQGKIFMYELWYNYWDLKTKIWKTICLILNMEKMYMYLLLF